MDMPGEVPRRETVRLYVEDLDGAKVGTYNQKPLIDNREYELEYYGRTHDRYFANFIDGNIY